MKQALEHRRQELDGCRAEITSLKMHIEGSQVVMNSVDSDVNNVQSVSLENYKEEIKKLRMEVEYLKAKNVTAPESGDVISSENEIIQTDDKIREIHEDKGAVSCPVDVALGFADSEHTQSSGVHSHNENAVNPEDALHELLNSTDANSGFKNVENVFEQNVEPHTDNSSLLPKSDGVNDEAVSEKTASSFPIVL